MAFEQIEMAQTKVGTKEERQASMKIGDSNRRVCLAVLVCCACVLGAGSMCGRRSRGSSQPGGRPRAEGDLHSGIKNNRARQ